MTLYDFDRQFILDDRFILAGTDEAGCGPLAGAVFAAAVVLPRDFFHPLLNDSKKVNEKNRAILFDYIRENTTYYNICSVDEKMIDEINILEARLLAMKNAVEGLGIVPNMLLVDGNKAPKVIVETTTVVKGDSASANIAAASILAKVARDRYMEQLAKEYPAYAFEQHKGYPTKLHYEKIKELGVLPIHRKSFLKNLNTK